MKKGMFVVSTLLLGLGAYYLYDRIKSGNVNYNFRNESIPEEDLEVNLAPPMEVPQTETLI